MNILQVVPYFPPAYAFGGPVTVAYSISKELVKRGHNVTVYTTDARSPNERLNIQSVMNVDGMEVHYMRNLSLTSIRVSNLFIPPEVAFVSKTELKKFDVIHLHEFTTFQNVAIAHLARKAGVPYVLQTHGSIHISARRKRKLLFNIMFGNKILRGASKVIALSNVEKLNYEFMGLADDKIVIIPNGIDFSDYVHLPAKGSFKKKFGLDKNEKIVLSLGRIHEIKGIDILVRAFANVAKKMSNARLVIAGPDDGYLHEIEVLIKTLTIANKILIVGPLYGREKLEAYVDADVYVLPSIYDAFPMTVLEAMACGTPIIVSRNCGFSEVERNKNMMVVNTTPTDIEQSILKILTDKEFQKVYKANYKLTIKQFDLATSVSKLEAVYQSLITSN